MTTTTSLYSSSRIVVLAVLVAALTSSSCAGGEGEGEGEGEGDAAEGEGEGEPFEGDPATVRLAGPCPLDERVGGFEAREDGQFSFVTGGVKDSVLPVSVLETIDADGDCAALRKNNPFCTPPCGPSQTCGFDGACVPFPLGVSVGTVVVDGLAEPVSMTPQQSGSGYSDTDVPRPVFVEGGAARLRADGAATGAALEMFGVGPELLDDGDVPATISFDTPLALTWRAPAGDVRSEVEVRLSVDQHGSTPVTLVCTFADTGSGTVPATMVNALLSAGVSGFPSGSLTRRTVDHQALGDGSCVDFTMSSQRVVDVTVE